MGILSYFGFADKKSANVAIDLGIASPWQEGNLTRIIPSEIFGTDVVDNLPMGRAEAIAIPAVSKARNLLVSSIAKFPLVALKGDGSAPDQPTFLYRSNGNVSPYERMAWTVDDLIFYGVSLWKVERGSVPAEMAHGPILDAEWVPMSAWRVYDGKIQLAVSDTEWRNASDEEVILFNSPFEGILQVGSRTLRGARDTELAWVGRMRNPIPLIELSITDDTNLEQEEVDGYVAAWAAKRSTVNGAIGFTPQGMEINTHGEVSADLFLEGRNAIRTDVGSFLNIRASMLDGTAGVDSLTYSTTEGERNSFYEFDLPFWTDPIEAALSQDKVVPRGTRVRFDKYETYAPTPNRTGAPVAD